MRRERGFTLIELLVVIAIIAILAVVVVLTLNPAQLLAQSRDANRVSDMATLQSALNIYTTDQSGSLKLGTTTNTAISIFDPNASSTCGFLGLPSLATSTNQSWACSSSSTYRNTTSTGWVGVNFNLISSGAPFGNLPVDPVNTTSTGLFYAYNTNGSQFQITANFESKKYKANYGTNVQTTDFPDVISGGTPGISALYSPTGLVGYWPLNEGSGSSTIDQSGNGTNGTWSGTLTNGSYYTSNAKVGNYAAITAGVPSTPTYAATAVAPPGLPTGAASRTISAWVNMAAFDASDSGIVSWGSNSSAALSGIDVTASGIILNDLYGGDCTGGTVTLNQWYMVTVTYDGSTDRNYVNGTLQQTCADSTRNTVSSAVWIGTRINYGASASTASIDEVRVYNRALSPAEIMALYNAEK